MQLLSCHPLQAPCSLDPFMSHLHLQIEGLWCNNHSFSTSRALTPEASIALQGAETALWKPGLLSQELNQSPPFIRQDPSVLYEMFAHSLGKWSLQFWWARALCASQPFPSCSYGTCRQLHWGGGEEAGSPLLLANHSPNLKLQQLLHKLLSTNYHRLQHRVME